MTDETRRNITVLITDEDSDERRHAAENLASESGLAPIAALAAALQDPCKGVRDTACRSLLSIGGPDAARGVVEYVCSPEIVTRNLATDLLVRIGEPGIPALLPYLSDVNQDVRKSVVDVLGLIGESVPPGIILGLLHDPDPNVVVSAVEALGNMRASEAIAGLEEVFHACPYARPAVAEALGKTGDPRSREFVMTELRRSLGASGDDPLTLLGLIEAAGALGDSGALAPLSEGFRGIPPAIQPAALHAIARIARRSGAQLPQITDAEKSLMLMLNREEIPFRLSAAAWLAEIGSPAAVSAMADAYGGAPEVDALLGPALLESPGGLGAIVGSLDSARGSALRARVALISQCALSRIGLIMRGGASGEDEDLVGWAFDAVARAWKGADQDARSAIVDAVFRLDGDRAVQFLDAVLEQPDPWLRMHVIEVIAAIADSRAPVYMARFLNDEDDMVRELAENLLRAKGFVSDEA